VKKELGSGKKWGVRFDYVLQEKPLGLANIYQVCEKALAGESFVAHLGDNIFTEGIKEAVDYFEREKPNGLVTMVHHSENRRLGVPYFDRKGRLKKYVEKPKNPPHDFAIPGLYFMDSNGFKVFRGKEALKPSARGEYEMPDAFQWLIDHGYRVDVVEYRGKWLDPGKFGDWIEANQYLLDRFLEREIKKCRIDGKSKVVGRVRIGKGCRIVDSEIRGPVVIGDGVMVRNSYIGPFTSVADECVIENSHVENSVLMRGVVIRNIRQPIDESVVGAEAEIYDEDGPTDRIKLFVGEKSKVKI